MSFADLGLAPELLRTIAREGYTEPTPIQAAAIPAVLAGHDLLAAAQTGTGKTAAFMLPILHRLHAGARAERRAPRVLVLTPTRELAAQVTDSATTYGRGLAIRSMAVFGGVSDKPQAATLARGVELLVATPGRLLDHIQQRTLVLSQVEVFILDEADRMLDMGFMPDIRRVLALLPVRRQNLLFSATFSNDIRTLAKTFMGKPVEIDVAPHKNAAADTVEQHMVPTQKLHKRALLAWLVGHHNWRQVLVFVRTKHGADRLARQLDEDGLATQALHGGKSQGARTRALAEFKAGRVRVLVATDIAARGIDIDQLPHVINYELPMVAEDYVHRIGRTGRAGETGQAVSLVCAEERGMLREIEKLLGRGIPALPVTEFVPPAASSIEREDTPRRADTAPRPGAQRKPKPSGIAHHAVRTAPNDARKPRPEHRRSRAASPRTAPRRAPAR